MAFPPINNFRFQTQEDQDHSFPSTQNLPSFLMMKRSMSFSGTENNNNNYHTKYLSEDGPENNLGHGDDDSSDDGNQFGVGEKKKRLHLEQVKALEKSFEIGNKLEPERKMQLARALGLQPKQIAIWFQNRRARWKTKQLERDYEVLRKQFEALKADNDALQLQNKKLHAELVALRNYRHTNEAGAINLTKETEGTLSNGSDNSSVVNLDISRPTSLMNSPVVSSQLNTRQQNMIFSPNMTQQLIQHHGTSRPDIQCFKVDQMVQDESFCSMFNGIDDHQGFWTWPDQNQFH